MSTVVEKIQCPSCAAGGGDNSQDNLVIYDDGGKHCFSCGHHERGDGMEQEETELVRPEFLSGHCSDLLTRGISQKICEKFGYQTCTRGGVTVHIANYKDEYGTTVAQKIRTPDKKFRVLGDSKKMKLYGQWAWQPSEKIHVVLCEGEIDALSIAEAQGGKYPVVSVPNGAQAAKKAVADNIEFLSGFKHVVVCFDNDDAGHKATKEIADVIEAGKLRVANLPLKDANEMILAGRSEELRNCLWNASEVRPDCVIGVEDLIEEALVRPTMGLSFPWETLTKLTYGFRNKAIYTIGAGSGVGKTEFIKDILYHFTGVHKMKCGILSFEQRPSDTLLRLAGAKLGKRLHLPGDTWHEDEIRAAMLSLKDSIYFYDHYGAQELQTAMSKIRYMVKSLGCSLIVIDPFTALAATMENERKGIDSAMAAFGALVHELDCSLLLVSHLAKPMNTEVSKADKEAGRGGTYEEGKIVTSSAFRGSQSIQYWTSFMIGLERNKLHEIPQRRTVTTVRILKDRFSGEADGCSFEIAYSRDTGRLEEGIQQEDIL